MEKKHIIVGSILVLFAIVLGSSLAWWTWSTSNEQNTNVVVTIGGTTINYEDGEDITNNNLIPTSTKEQGISKDITISSTNTVYLDLNMTVVALDDGLKDESFKYELYNGNNLVAGGSFVSGNVNDVINLLSGVEITSIPVTYTLYIWIDGNMDNPNTMYNKNFEFRLNASVTDEKPPVPAIETISNIYNGASKTQVTNNNIQYNYATEVGLMEDIGGNIRYYGADPNNYVLFNNELWRIIGVFKNIDDGTGNEETRLKIVRNERLGSYAWDSNGSNEWPNATLNTYLNSTYLAGLTADAQNMIGDALWNLGGSSEYENLYVNDYYTLERGTAVYLDHSTTWIGKLALMYPSDYLYAGDLSKCSLDGYNWNNDTTNCRDTSWLIDTSAIQWTLTPVVNHEVYAFYIRPTGSVNYSSNVINDYASYPVFYLKSIVLITGGDGSSDNPFTLSVATDNLP